MKRIFQGKKREMSKRKKGKEVTDFVQPVNQASIQHKH